jgi:hypothetical protein
MASLEELQQLEQFVDPRSVQSENERIEMLSSEQFKFSQLLLKDEMVNVKPDISKKWWVFFDKEMSLTGLTIEDRQWIMSNWDIIKIDNLMAKPDFDLRFEDQNDFANMRVKAFIKISRSIGADRERVLLTTQIKQLMTNENEQIQGGFLSKLGSLFGGKK